jgi:hypothetical protein
MNQKNNNLTLAITKESLETMQNKMENVETDLYHSIRKIILRI